jgi:hypothetical protein
MDPMSGRNVGNRLVIDVPNELLGPGPSGDRIEVIDFDGAHGCFYPPVNLDDPAILMQSGLEPAESDPRFHQQLLYGIAMKTLENFDRALGRRIEFRTRKAEKLRLIPHAFHGANAFYSRDLNAVVFGYFRADKTDPGRNLPGQNVFTCLSHDIIVHEMTHAVVDRLRRFFHEPTNEDVLAFHEGFSDIVALFQHFTFSELLRSEIQRTASKLESAGPLVGLAQQFGEATGMGRALRSALGDEQAKLSPTLIEPHDRGSILVAAVFDGFFTCYKKRINDLLRIATGGTGRLPRGDLHPDLVNRIATEAARTAQGVLNMCIRAFDYLPPVDVTFGDYLRALVTADYELLPGDEVGQRSAMIEAFRQRRIYPEGVTSLAEESLVWQNPSAGPPPIPVVTETPIMGFLVSAATNFGRIQPSHRSHGAADIEETEEGQEIPDLSKQVAWGLHSYAETNRAALLLHPTLSIQVAGFHSVFRVAPTGQLLIEIVAQFVQTDRSNSSDRGGLPLRGGTTVIAAADGTVRYVIAKPLPHDSLEQEQRVLAENRIRRQETFLSISDQIDPQTPYQTQDERANRMLRRADLSRLHRA